MQLARATAARALADLAVPEAPEQQPEAPQSERQAAEPPPEAALAVTPRRTAARPTTTSRTPTDPGQAFIRLAAAVCELTALEAGLAARRGTSSPAPRADPRREPLLKAFREVTEHAENRAILRYEFAFRLDNELTADPEQILGLPELFIPLCEALEIELDYAKLSDEIIGMGPATGANGEILGDDPHRIQPPNTRATSPP